MSHTVASPDVAFLLPTLGGGGAEKAAVQLASAFAKRGLTIDFVLMQVTGPLLTGLPASTAVFDLGVDRVRHVTPALVQYLRVRKPRSLLVFMWPLNAAAVLAQRLANVETRTVLTEHTDWSVDPLGRGLGARLLLKTTTRLAYPRADAVVAVSDGAAQSLAQSSGLGRGGIQVVYNPITPLAPAGRPEPDLCERWRADGATLIAIGRLHPQKAYPVLMQALRIVADARPARLLILGEGPDRLALEALRAKLGLDETILMPGFVSDPYAYLKAADLFVLSSNYEALPTVVIEALACGTPVVSTDCRSGPREILADGRYGDLVPVGDPEALAAAMLSALDRRHDKAALVERSADFSIEKAVDAYLRLLLPDETWPDEAACA